MTLPPPHTMQAIEISESGGPEVLKPVEVTVPVPNHGEILIRIAYAGVNRPDALQRAGLYAPPPTASPLPGLEAAGWVAAVGPGVTKWQPGDKVTALLPGGGYAEYALAPADHALPVPAGMSLREAACLPETFFTVWTNVFERGHLEAGERFLVHGGTSGIGTTAIQLAKAFGATVYATAGSDEKCAACLRLGADAAINYRSQDFAEETRRLTDKKGVDVILDMVGGGYFQRNLRSLAWDGRLVLIAFLGGHEVEKADLRPIMLKRLTVTGSTMRPRTTAEKGAIAAELEARVWPLLARGESGPLIHKVFPLAEAAAAHALMESSAHIGKIMLAVRT